MYLFWFTATVFILCFGIMRKADTSDAKILRLALILTLAADFCFAFIDDPIYGVNAFCCVQLVYCLRYGGSYLCAAVSGLWIAILPWLIFAGTDPIFVSAALYAVAFTCSLSAAYAVKYKYPHPNGTRVVMGMTLFALCDICVGLNYLFPGMAYPLMWAFYLPGQAALAVSGIRAEQTALFLDAAH